MPGAKKFQESAFSAPFARSSPRASGPLFDEVVVQLGAALALSLFAGLVLGRTDDWETAAGLLAGAAFTAVGVLRPALFLSALLLIRPLLDGVGANQDAGSGTANGGLGVVLIIVMVFVVATSRDFRAPRNTIAFIALVMVSALAAIQTLLSVNGVDQMQLVNELVRILALVSMFILASQVVRSETELKHLFVVVGLSGVLPAILGIKELIEGPQAVAGFSLGRISGPFGGPVPFSSFLAVTGLVLLSLPRDALKPVVRFPALTLIMVALVGTYSREGWILFLVGLVLIHWRDRKQVVLAVVAACLLTVAIVPNVRDRVLPARETSDGRTTFESFDWRTQNWRGLLDKYSERPVTGWGLKSTRYVNPRAPIGGQDTAGGGYEAHNTIVRALVEGGIPLLLVYCLLFVAIVRTMYLAAMDRGWSSRPYARIVFSLWIGIAVIGLGTDDPLEATAMMLAMLALTGAIEGVHRRGRQARA